MLNARRRGPVFAVGMVLALTGCSSGSAVAAPPSSSPSPVPSPSVTRSPVAVLRIAPTHLQPETHVTSSQPLAGKVIVLDPGHNALNSTEISRANAPVPAGGFTKPCNTSGTSTDAGYPEHAYTFDVAIRAAALLRAQGAKVILTRPNDKGFGPCVNERAAIANRAHADATIAIHADGAAASGFGFHVIEPALAPDKGNTAILGISARLGLDLRNAFTAATGEPFANYVAHDGLIKRSDLAGLNLARVPAVFIECGNMRNASDAAKLTSEAFRQRAAVGIDNALLAFLR